MMFGKKLSSYEKLQQTLDKLLTNQLKEKLWIQTYGNIFDPYCISCKRNKINPYICQWSHINVIDHTIELHENNIQPICRICDLYIQNNKRIN